MKHARVVAQLDADVEAIIAGLTAALAHLEEWTGEYPASASGAPPATATGTIVDADVLTRFEQMADTGDPATRYQLQLLGRLRTAALQARSMMAGVDGVALPVELEADTHDLAVLRWTARRLRLDAARVGAGPLNRLARNVETVRRLVDQWQPPTAGPITGCRLHRAIGTHAPIDHHNHSAQGLCRKCGTFRCDYDADPTPAILRAWSRGQKPTAAQIAEAKTVAKKRRREKMKSKRRTA